MTRQDFIEKAIEGGWEGYNKYPIDTAANVANQILREFCMEEILLDPLAWQAVVKVEKKSELGVLPPEIVEKRVKLEALSRMNRMVDYLSSEGNTTEQFLATL